MRVLAVDPGKATGMALFEQRNGDPEIFASWVEPDPMGAIDRARLELMEGLDAVVCEGFRIGGARAKEANLTIEIIGALRWICHKRGCPFVVQDPGAGHAFMGKRWEKLRRLDWYRPGPDHPNSAAGHLVLYLVKSGAIEPRRVVLSTEGTTT